MSSVYIISVAPDCSDFREEKHQQWLYTEDVPEDIAHIIQSRSYSPEFGGDGYKELYAWISSQRPFKHWNRLYDGTMLLEKNVYVVNLNDCCFHV